MILNDTLYTMLGGWTGTSTSAQRIIAYEIAEEYLTEHLETPLSPTQLSGTIVRSYEDNYHLSPYLHSVDHIRFINECNEVITGTATIVNYEDGTIRIDSRYAHVPSRNFFISYTAGLPSGTIPNSNRYMLALSLYAGIILQELSAPWALEGGAGDPGVISWNDNGHSETRINLVRTTFGSSPIANRAAQLLRPLKRKRAYRL